MSQPNVLALLNQPDINIPEIFLEHALSQLLTSLPSAQAVAVYQVATNGVVVWQTNGISLSQGDYISFDEKPNLKQVMETGQHHIDDTYTVVLPLHHQQDIIALLEVHHDESPDIDQLQSLALDLAIGVHAKQMDALLAQKSKALQKLSGARTLLEVDVSIASTMARVGQYVGMNVFEFDEQGKVAGARVIATANSNNAFPTDTPFDSSPESLQTLHDIILVEGDVLITNLATEERFDKRGTSWLMSQRAHGVYVLPLQINEGKVRSFISLLDTQQSLALTPTQKQFFKNLTQQAASIIDRQQLVERTLQSASQSGEQAEVLTQINMLINTINAGKDADFIFEQMATILLNVTGVDHVGVVLRQDDKAIVVGEAPSMGYTGRAMEIGADSLHALLEQIREPIVIADVASDENVPEGSRAVLMESNIVSLAVIPMFDENDNLLGSIGLDYFTAQDEISSSMVETAQNIVTQVALTLQKLQLLSEAQERTTQLQQITEFGQSLRAYLTVEEILATTLQYTPDLMTSDYVGVLLYDRRIDSLRDSATFWDDEIAVNRNASPITKDINNVADRAWQTRELVEIVDMNTWDWHHPQSGDLQSMLAIPLISGGVLLGVLEVGSKQINAYKPVNVTTMRQISNQLSIALSNAEAYLQSQQLAQNKSRANDIITKLQQQMEIQDILKTTVQELGQALGAKNGRIRLGTPPANDKTNGTGA